MLSKLIVPALALTAAVAVGLGWRMGGDSENGGDNGTQGDVQHERDQAQLQDDSDSDTGAVASSAIPETPRPRFGPEPPPDRTAPIYSLYLSKIDLTLKEGRKLVYYSDDPSKGVSELDLSKYIGNRNGKLVWDSFGFHTTAVKAQLCNGHVLVARLLKNDGKTTVDSWINLDMRIHCDSEVLEYDPGRERYGGLPGPWTMKSYHVFGS
ncbi:hypothetical protein D9756_000919 [Leucocoprinus leucothites]|uniref:Cyanovirin-N domain-containing protein n=1 Tax=Leucocoprinus leucothites TaxID=201217 RepID=A0A8H5GEV8_9AGAR|nr:hypothetical protein D9756_000919 [Leucoagaricus leucothites]